MYKIKTEFFKKPRFRFLCGVFDIFFSCFLLYYIYMPIDKILEYLNMHNLVNFNLGNILFITYFLIIPYVTNGQTLGQFIFGLKTVSLKSEKLTFLQIIARQIMCLWGMNYILEVIGMQKFTNDNNQFTYDKFCLTTVIAKNKYEDFLLLNIKEKVNTTYLISMFVVLIPIYLVFIDVIEFLDH